MNKTLKELHEKIDYHTSIEDLLKNIDEYEKKISVCKNKEDKNIYAGQLVYYIIKLNKKVGAEPLYLIDNPPYALTYTLKKAIRSNYTPAIHKILLVMIYVLNQITDFLETYTIICAKHYEENLDTYYSPIKKYQN